MLHRFLSYSVANDRLPPHPPCVLIFHTPLEGLGGTRGGSLCGNQLAYLLIWDKSRKEDGPFPLTIAKGVKRCERYKGAFW